MDLRNVTNVLRYLTESTERNLPTILKEGNLVTKYNDVGFEQIYLPSFIFSFIMLVLGCFGNTFALYVYFFKWKKSTYRVFILALVVLDLINGLITIPSELYFRRNWFQTTNEVLCKVAKFCTVTLLFSSEFTLIGIAVDRYFRVCRPLQKQMSTKNAKIIVLVGISMGIVIASPLLFFYGIKTREEPIAPHMFVLGHMCGTIDNFKDSVITKIFLAIISLSPIFIACILITIYSLIVLNTRKRFVYVRKASWKKQTEKDQGEPSIESKVLNDPLQSARRPSVSELNECPQEETNTCIKVTNKTAYDNSDTYVNCTTSQSKNIFSSQIQKNQHLRVQKITLMLFLITVVFILTFSPSYALLFIVTLQPNYYTNLSINGKAIYQFFTQFYLLGMSAKSVVYSSLSENFRMECDIVLRRLWKCFNQIQTCQ